jgi:hypothetical protein
MWRWGRRSRSSPTERGARQPYVAVCHDEATLTSIGAQNGSVSLKA